MAEANLLGKRKLEDDLETKPILKRHDEKETTKGCAEQNKVMVDLLETKYDEANLISVKETVEVLDETPDFVEEVFVPKKTLFVGAFSPKTRISDIVEFFKDVGEVVRVQLIVDRNGDYAGCGFVEFASANEAKKALQEKNGEYLYHRKVFLDVANKGAAYLPPKYCMDHKVWYEEDYLQGESLTIEEDEPPPDFVEAVLLVANLSPQTTSIIHIVDFFIGVAEVVSVRLIVNHKGKHVGYAFVEFASADEANRALEERNGEYLHDHKILLMKGLDTTPDFVKAVSTRRNKTLFVTNLSPRTKISYIINFFKYVGEVVHVRLVVDHKGNLMGYGFVEFASANEAKKALEEKNGEYLCNSKIFLEVADKGATYLLRPMYCIDHIVWYEDYLQQKSVPIEEDAAAVEGLDETPNFAKEVDLTKKTVFVASLSQKIRISKIMKMFKYVGEVVRVRLIVNHWGEPVGCCFVEFASADKANKAVQMKNGWEFFVKVAEITASYPFRPKYNLVEKLWYEDNLRRESLCLYLETKKEKVIFCGMKINFFDE